MSGPYHHGEREVQRRAGLRREAEVSGRAIRDTVPPVAASFLTQQRLLVAGAADDRGDIWATVLTGPAGFLRAEDEHSLSVAARPAPADPLAAVLERPVRLGMLAIEAATRRRMRMNGTARPHGGGLLVDLDQVVANCPKYIQKRTPPAADPGPPPAAAPLSRVRGSDRLDDGQRRFLAGADTFFIATADEHGRADASHRGGNPGFLQAPSPTLVRWPDYTGNAMFLTLGNLLVNSRAGLVVPDYATGATLHLTGSARIVWGAEDAGSPVPTPADTGRVVEFTVTGVAELPGTLPAGWSPPALSRFNPPVPATGAPSAA
ncbi:pyridoxamine 5'-phosphate oxidase family protein [Streptomyces sp. CNQ085]|uniref:pyridoxamine 5'-phosphate oxidase family protein n=1 Tax=Streptomyces sp. CNQ085 TaxID=2886944 RepID=UPI001F512246|nr:pyridoxamine 5'-phosphate oxidase family protein [Streptomyces sp. CNQ085]MCI0384328.1 pyridoxamine 5'-phosphate oxidase family protein [Streptomyces sp. CNQ085]